MPIFEYRCDACGEQLEKITRKPLDEVPCPKCSQPARRVVSVFAASGNVPSTSGCAPAGGSGFR